MGVHCIVLYWVVLCEVVWQCMVLDCVYGVAFDCVVLYDVVWDGIVLCGAVWYCVGLYGSVWYCMV